MKMVETLGAVYTHTDVLDKKIIMIVYIFGFI